MIINWYGMMTMLCNSLWCCLNIPYDVILRHSSGSSETPPVRRGTLYSRPI